MIVMIVIGWVVVLPIGVVLGLLCASKVLGRRGCVSEAAGLIEQVAIADEFAVTLDSAGTAEFDSRRTRGQSISAGS